MSDYDPAHPNHRGPAETTTIDRLDLPDDSQAPPWPAQLAKDDQIRRARRRLIRAVDGRLGELLPDLAPDLRGRLTRETVDAAWPVVLDEADVLGSDGAVLARAFQTVDRYRLLLAGYGHRFSPTRPGGGR